VLIGTIVLVVGIGAYVKMGSASTSHDKCSLHAKAMMEEFKIEEDLSNEDAEEYNMHIIGDIKMYTKGDF